MAKESRKTDTAAENRSSNKIVAAVGILLALITAATVFLLTKDHIFMAAARNATIDMNYKKAETLADLCSGDEAETLGEYIDLMQEISSDYPTLRINFDRNKVESWQKTAAELKNSGVSLGDEIDAQLEGLSGKLDAICSTLAEYDALHPDIMSLFDVFNETNRLYSKDANGENTVFTISDELASILKWEETAKKLEGFLANTANGEKMYLFAFFIKEALGEAADLRESILKFAEQGYDLNAQIRVTGEVHRTFPSIRNSDGSTLNLQNKESYEAGMFSGMCTELTETLGEYSITK